MKLPIADLWSLMSPHLGYGKIMRPAAIEFPMGNNLDSAYVWEDDTRIVIGFAGTKPKPADWWQNFRVVPNAEGIHRGFADSGREFLDRDFVDFLKGAPEKRIELTGMSQGAAQACVVATYLHLTYKIHTHRIVHYGGPPWGIEGAVLRLERECDEIIRVIAGLDPVEVGWLPLRREGTRVQLQGCPDGELNPVKNHDPRVYTLGIRKYCIEHGDTRGVEAMDNLLYGEA